MPGARTVPIAMAICAACALTLTAGDPVPRAPLPPLVAEAVRGIFPRGPVVAVAYDNTEGGREYEAHLRVDGRDAYVVATDDGVVRETGQAVDEQAAPAEVREALRLAVPEGPAVTECFRREFHRGPDGGPLETPCVFYEFTLGAGRDEVFLAINADGSLRLPEARDEDVE